MKKYIILSCPNGIGGWQLYTDARVQYLTEQGIKVYVLYQDNIGDSPIVLKDLKNGFTKNIRQLCFQPQLYTKRQRKNILREIKEFIGYSSDDEYFIESTSMSYSYWGEVIASEIKAVNYSYLLHSHIENVPEDVQKFFAFKYKNNLLAGQSKITLPDLFKGYMDVEEDSREIIATWDPSFAKEDMGLSSEIEQIHTLKSKGYKIIGYFGTLEKNNFLKLCDFLKMYTKKHSKENFLFISIGSSTKNIAEKYQLATLGECTNCENMNIKAMYPVPERIFELLDICVASWGSAISASRACKRTIRLLDDLDIVPHGIMGITIKVYPYYQEPVVKETLEELFDNILYKDAYGDVEYVMPETVDFRLKHKEEDLKMEPFKKREKKYYDILNLSVHGFDKKMCYILLRILGFNITVNIKKFLMKL